jgi:hypothetical protein
MLFYDSLGKSAKYKKALKTLIKSALSRLFHLAQREGFEPYKKL